MVAIRCFASGTVGRALDAFLAVACVAYRELGGRDPVRNGFEKMEQSKSSKRYFSVMQSN